MGTSTGTVRLPLFRVTMLMFCRLLLGPFPARSMPLCGAVSGALYSALPMDQAKEQPPEAAAEAKAPQPGDPSDDELDEEAEKSFSAVLRHGPDVQLDHYIIYHCHFELGKLYARRGDIPKAKHNFEVVMSGKSVCFVCASCAKGKANCSR